ncbi:hypothetical protein J2S94_000429 [Arthrobacter bambusae]|nr:hypothetical protein [Arthrobacter bambusae]
MERPDGPAKGAGTPERGLGRLVGFCGCGCVRSRLPTCPRLRFRGRLRGATALRRRRRPWSPTRSNGPSPSLRHSAYGVFRSLSDLQTPMRRDALLPEGPQHRSCHRSVWRLAFNAEALRRHAKFLSTLESAHRISLSASLANLGVENRPRFTKQPLRPAPGPPTPIPSCRRAKSRSTPESAQRFSRSVSRANLGVEIRSFATTYRLLRASSSTAPYPSHRWRTTPAVRPREVTYPRRRRFFRKERIAALRGPEVAQRPSGPTYGPCLSDAEGPPTAPQATTHQGAAQGEPRLLPQDLRRLEPFEL